MATNQMRREAAKRKLENQQQRREEQARRRKRNAMIASVVTVVVVVATAVAVYVYATAPEELGPDTSASPTVPLPVRPQALPASVDCAYTPGAPASKPVTPPANGAVSTNGTVPVALDTSAGPVDLTLNRGLAPCTVNSFVNLAQKGFYNDTQCHRITTGPGLQVLQCGDPTPGDPTRSGSGGPGYTIPDEVFPGLTYGRGLLAMAKTAAPNSGGSQFFMIYGDADLPPEYTVFGSIGEEGLSTLTEVGKAGAQNGAEDGAPATPVEIRTATAG